MMTLEELAKSSQPQQQEHGATGKDSPLDVLADAISHVSSENKEDELTDGAESLTSLGSSSSGKKRKLSGNSQKPKRSRTVLKRKDSTLGELGPGVSQNKGRFLKSEKKILFSLIREDPGLFHAFLHQRKERMYGTKSWMHEIAQRYNRVAKDKRSLEAIRHHLMFRKTSATRSDKNSERVLFEHAKQCEQPETCTKCLIFQRSCVQSGVAKCGFDECTECSEQSPHVAEMISTLGERPSTPVKAAAKPKPTLDLTPSNAAPLKELLESTMKGIQLYPGAASALAPPPSAGFLALLGGDGGMAISPTAASLKTLLGNQGPLGTPRTGLFRQPVSLNTSGLLAALAPRKQVGQGLAGRALQFK